MYRFTTTASINNKYNNCCDVFSISVFFLSIKPTYNFFGVLATLIIQNDIECYFGRVLFDARIFA
jgi:hypothetical protein